MKNLWKIGNEMLKDYRTGAVILEDIMTLMRYKRKDVALRLGCSVGLVDKILAGQREFTPDNHKALLDCAVVEIDEIRDNLLLRSDAAMKRALS